MALTEVRGPRENCGMQNLRLLTRVALACLISPMVACSNGNDSATTTSLATGGRTSTGGSSGLEIDAGDPVTLSCLKACNNYSRYCGDSSCSIVCSVTASTYDFAHCPKEAQTYFDCVAQQTNAGLSCAPDAGSTMSGVIDALVGTTAPKACKTSFNALFLCNSTKGADCAPETALDESCAVTDSVHPHFLICKADVVAPANCVPYSSLSTGWYCCP